MNEDNTKRIEKLLALLLINTLKEGTMADKAFQLNLAGLTNGEIAELLGTSSGVIAQSLYEKKKKTNKSTKNKKG